MAGPPVSSSADRAPSSSGNTATGRPRRPPSSVPAPVPRRLPPAVGCHRCPPGVGSCRARYRPRVTDKRPGVEQAAQARGETPAQVLDRNLNELLQELRVVLTGVQILFAFPLA